MCLFLETACFETLDQSLVYTEAVDSDAVSSAPDTMYVMIAGSAASFNACT